MPLAAIAGPIIAGMGGAASAATIGAAAIGAGASIYASGQQTKAAQQGMQAQQNATNAAIAAQERALAQTQANNQPFMEGGYAGLDALLGEFGLRPQNAQGQVPTQAQYDIPAYIQNNADVQQRAQELQQQGVIGPGGQFATPEDWVSQVQLPNALAAGEQRDYAERPTTGTPTDGVGGTSFEQQMAQFATRPDAGPRPEYLTAEYQAGPSEADYFDNFETSPFYDYMQNEARRAVNVSQFSRGIGSSGGTMKALQDRAGMVASGYQNQWFGQQDSKYRSAIAQSQFANNFNLSSTQQQNALRQSGFESDRLDMNSNFDADRGFTANENQRRISNLGALVAMGQNAASGVNSAGSNFAANTGNLYNTNANALAAGYGQIADARASGVNALAGGAQGLLSTLGSNNRAVVQPNPVMSAVPQFMPRPTSISGFRPAGMPQVSF